MAGYSIQVKGLAALMVRLNRYPERVRTELRRELQAAAQATRTGAVKDAPKNNGQLANSIFVEEANDGMTQQVGVAAGHAAVMEWGSKRKTRVPAQLQAYAAQFKGQQVGSGEGSLKEAIEKWVKRKGIGAKRTKSGKVSRSQSSQTRIKQVAFMIARSIYINGVTPHPFLFKHVFLQRKRLEGRIPKIIKNV